MDEKRLVICELVHRFTWADGRHSIVAFDDWVIVLLEGGSVVTGTFVGVDFEDEHLTIGLADCGDLTLSFSQVRMLRPCPRDAGIATDDCKSVLDDWTEPEEDVE